jgi:hypothetical protein
MPRHAPCKQKTGLVTRRPLRAQGSERPLLALFSVLCSSLDARRSRRCAHSTTACFHIAYRTNSPQIRPNATCLWKNKKILVAQISRKHKHKHTKRPNIQHRRCAAFCLCARRSSPFNTQYFDRGGAVAALRVRCTRKAAQYGPAVRGPSELVRR